MLQFINIHPQWQIWVSSRVSRGKMSFSLGSSWHWFSILNFFFSIPLKPLYRELSNFLTLFSILYCLLLNDEIKWNEWMKFQFFTQIQSFFAYPVNRGLALIRYPYFHLPMHLRWRHQLSISISSYASEVSSLGTSCLTSWWFTANSSSLKREAMFTNSCNW